MCVSYNVLAEYTILQHVLLYKCEAYIEDSLTGIEEMNWNSIIPHFL